jgi:hypothetical protein
MIRGPPGPNLWVAGSGSATEIAIASGIGFGTSWSLNKRKPITFIGSGLVCSGLPQWGHAASAEATAGVKRVRQGGQLVWVIGNPLRGQAVRWLSAEMWSK